MPGGIGPVDSECARALCRNRREVRLPASADEVQIFFNLSMDRVHYAPARNAIYFVDSRHLEVPGIIRSVMRSLGICVPIEQLHLDRAAVFKGGMRLILPMPQARVLLVALRLKGVQISVAY